MAHRPNIPMSVFCDVFDYLEDVAHLPICVPDETVEWLSALGYATQGSADISLLGEDSRRVSLLLLRILLPADAEATIDDIERFEQAKWECVHAERFEDATGWQHKRDVAFEELGRWFSSETTVTPSVLQQVFGVLERERRGK